MAFFVPALGKAIKETVVSVVADILGTHSVAGFVESFAGSYVCRFCVGERSKFQSDEVRFGSCESSSVICAFVQHNFYILSVILTVISSVGQFYTKLFLS